MELSTLISFIILIGLLFAAAIYQFSAIAWTIIFGIALLIVTGNVLLPVFWLILFWLIYLAAAAFSNLHDLRKRYLIKPALKILKEKMPSISNTERIAIEAGDTWWEKELFCGRPDWKKLYDVPKPSLSEKEQQFIDHQVEHLCSLLNDWDIIFKDHNLPNEAQEYRKKEKFSP